MSETAANQTRYRVLGALAIGVIGAVAFYAWPAPKDIPYPAPQLAATPDPVPEPVPESVPETTALTAPTFDTFRLDSDGGMVVAGRAAPGQVVELILADEVIASVMADASGSFVMLTEAGTADAPRRLSLLADPGGAALPSQGSYMLAPISPPATIAQAPAADQPGITADQPTPVLAEVASPDPDPAGPPVVVQADADGVRIVQGVAATATPNVALDAITYDPQGTLQLAGRATGSGQVQIYLDDRPVSTAPVLEGRDWRIDLPDIATGLYNLRIDEVDAAGMVVSRLETPFRREEAADVAAVMAEDTARDGFEVAVRTVQPGSTLWAIAEETLGSGIFFVEVFEANSDLIRDPDLIYPGQIFRIPDRAP